MSAAAGDERGKVQGTTDAGGLLRVTIELGKVIGDVELNDLGARSAMFWLPADADLQHAASGRD